MSIDTLVADVRDASLSLFGLVPERSTITLHDDYPTFCAQHNLKSESDGVYLPPRFEAHIDLAKRPALGVLHEFFGHGLYCEYAKQAQELAANRPTPHLESVAESVAVWIEGKLATATGLADAFNEKYDEYQSPAQEMENTYGHTITMFSHGFPKYYNTATLDDILTRILGTPYQETQAALVFGSRKPYSDIDIYLITDEPIPEISNHWLDVHVRTPQAVKEGIALLDSEMTHPLLTGDAIRGNEYITDLRHRIATTPITIDAIHHNARLAERYDEEARAYNTETEDWRMTTRSAYLHRKLAHELTQGRRTLTYDELLPTDHPLRKRKHF